MLETPLLIVALLSFPVGVLLAVQVVRGHRKMPVLAEIGPGPGSGPKVSVIVAARNEERKLEAAVRSMAGQDHPDLELIVVDDRSTDATGAILGRLAREDERVRAIHVEELPAGWLGKVHALHVGARAASGAILLFTDADIVFDPSAVARAVAYLERAGLDHLTAAARIEARSPLLQLAVATFILQVTRGGQPWRAADQESRRFAGLGAFNMVRTEAYRAIGGHASMRMALVDDLELGKRLKAAGYRQAMALPGDMIRVEWYPTTPALVRGLRKNGFAAAGYKLRVVLAITVGVLALDVWPWAALVLTGGATFWLNAGLALAAAAAFWDVAPRYGLSRWLGPALPIGALIILYAGWTSTIATLWGGGITWRGTRYSLRELRGR